MKKIILIVLINILLLASDNGMTNKEIMKINDITLNTKYDVFTTDNKEYIIAFKAYNKSLGERKEQKKNKYNLYSNWPIATLRFKSLENSNNIEISSSLGKGDGRYSRRRGGSFKFKFDNDKKIYKINGYSYYLSQVYANISKTKNKELLQKIATKSFMYVKISVVGYSKVYKFYLKGARKILKKAKFID